MPLPTAYYKVSNGGLFLALASETPNTPLSLQQDDGSSQMKWHTENQNSGAYYYLFSFYDGSTRKLGATVTTALAPDADVVGGTASKQWVITHAPGAASDIYSVVINGYAVTNNNGLVQLEAFDSTASSVPANQQWSFTKWQ